MREPLPSVSAKLKCPVLAILKCPLFRGSEAACRTMHDEAPGRAHRLQAARRHRYEDHAVVTDRATRAVCGRRRCCIPQSVVGPVSHRAGGMLPQERNHPEQAKISNDAEWAAWAAEWGAPRAGHFSFAEKRTFQLCSDRCRDRPRSVSTACRAAHARCPLANCSPALACNSTWSNRPELAGHPSSPGPTRLEWRLRNRTLRVFPTPFLEVSQFDF